MEAWRLFWTVFCGLGLVSFVILVAVVAPFGFRDLRRLFSALGGPRATTSEIRHNRE